MYYAMLYSAHKLHTCPYFMKHLSLYRNNGVKFAGCYVGVCLQCIVLISILTFSIMPTVLPIQEHGFISIKWLLSIHYGLLLLNHTIVELLFTQPCHGLPFQGLTIKWSSRSNCFIAQASLQQNLHCNLRTSTETFPHVATIIVTI